MPEKKYNHTELRRIANQWLIDEKTCGGTDCINQDLTCCGTEQVLEPKNWWHETGYVPCFLCSYNPYLSVPIHPQDPL